MKCGDKNASLFHRKASARKKKNEICRLFDKSNTWVEGDRDLKEVVSSYFKEIFTSSSPSQTYIDETFEGVDSKITPVENKSHTQVHVSPKSYSVREVRVSFSRGLVNLTISLA